MKRSVSSVSIAPKSLIYIGGVQKKCVKSVAILTVLTDIG